MSTTGQAFDIDEEALLRDVDGKTDDSIENEDAILADDDFDIEDDDINPKTTVEQPKAMEPRLKVSMPDEAEKVLTEKPKQAQRQKIIFLEETPSEKADVKSASADAREKRKERFGTVAAGQEPDPKLKRAQRFGVANEKTAKLARIARFGEVKATEPAKVARNEPKATRGRKGQPRSRGDSFTAFDLSVMETSKQKKTVKRELRKEQDDVKRQRATRFQLDTSAATSGSVSDEERKRSRAQRFGLAS